MSPGREIKDIAASVRARLLNLAKQTISISIGCC